MLKQMAGGTLFDAGAAERQAGVHQRRTRAEIVGLDYCSKAAGASADRNEIVVLHGAGRQGGTRRIDVATSVPRLDRLQP